ncbi:hypothetical protein F5883DRAFT_259449 [Diaporthe sp. PMI_573]|nr:hypothetical protein F5883DRAFT_259449 [Diaporthaceae sp. PMI_573]
MSKGVPACPSMKQFTKTANSLLWTLSLTGLVLQASISSRTTLRTLEVPENSRGSRDSSSGAEVAGLCPQPAGARRRGFFLT